ncbi:hypothetical protein [Neolewinella sp.]|uniref:hypothetical protein n=1 Tax=Neolewinella sp. TaxID=2993543 RepID=UPI003B5170BA
MKPLLIAIALLLCTCALAAQQERRHVQESEHEDSYFFRVRLDPGKSSELMHCMNQVTDNNINVHMRGDLTTNIDEHATLHIDTHDRTLIIEHTGDQPEERKRVKEIVARTKQCLDIQATPPPPPHNEPR